MDVVSYPSKILSEISVKVIQFDDRLRQLVHDMIETMYQLDGVGLAAPQISELSRVIVVDPSGGKTRDELLVMVNPVVVWTSDASDIHEEGCLSLPNVVTKVKRSIACDIEYDDVYGIKSIKKCTGMLARITQHEIDHLDGILMIDRVGMLARRVALRDR
jgi:peptide deformylase